ncbi:hypothetical protein BX600DRAFT_496504 [Xylariales sp. PMI_506]|nr:hypothetical protein BX600DRAFT_496504 [Xylariales sp. PMI_506]
MYRSLVIPLALGLVTLLSGVAASQSELQVRKTRDVFGGDSSFCWGDNGICSVGLTLFDTCDGYSDTDSWFSCICASGYVSVEDACYWCELAYNLDIDWNGPSYTAECNSVSADIAPIPASVLSVESAWNASYTGVILGGSITSGAGAITATGTSKLATATGKSNKTSSAEETTWFGGTTGVQTLDGGGSPQRTSATSATGAGATSTTTKPSSNQASDSSSRTSLAALLLILSATFGIIMW